MGLYVFIRRAIKQIVVIYRGISLLSTTQNFIQHPAVKINPIHTGNYWVSSM